MTIPPRAWRIPSGPPLLWHRWPGETEYIFYHGGTGSTHRLSEVAGVVWEMINDRQGDEAVLLRWLLDEGDDDAEVTLAAVLGQLARLELIEPDHAVG